MGDEDNLTNRRRIYIFIRNETLVAIMIQYLLILAAIRQSENDSSYNYVQKKYTTAITDDNVKNSMVNYLWNASPLRRIINGLTRRDVKRLSKRQLSAAATPLGLSGPAWVDMVKAFYMNNATADAVSDKFFGGTYDLLSLVLIVGYKWFGIANGGTMMVAKAFFSGFTKKPALVDPDLFFKLVLKYVQNLIPSADQIFSEIKPYIGELANNAVDMRFQKQYQEQQGKSLVIVSQYLNILEAEQPSTSILSSWEKLVFEFAREMSFNKLPLKANAELNFEVYETATAVAVYPQFISILIMALKEWYAASKIVGQRATCRKIEILFNDYVEAFRVQYDKLVKYWLSSSNTHISKSHFEGAGSGKCLMTLKVPNGDDIQGYVVDTRAEQNYKFENQTVTKTKNIMESTCGDTKCRFVNQLDDKAENICTYERIFERNCKKACSRRKQAFSWLIPIFGAGNSKCFVNKEECDFTHKRLELKNETCKPSNCTIQFGKMKSQLTSRLERNVEIGKKSVLNYKEMMKNISITDISNFQEAQLTKFRSLSLQKFIEKDEVFNGDICHGTLGIPKKAGAPKICITNTKSIFSCPITKDGKHHYVLFPDIVRNKIGKHCPRYLRYKKDVVTKQKVNHILGKIASKQEFLNLKESLEKQESIILGS